MNRHDKRLIELTKMAEDLSRAPDYKHAAALYIGNQVVSYGVNEFKSHPLQKRFRRNEHTLYLHAEIAAIKNALRSLDVTDLSRATLYVARSAAGKSRNSKPCEGCQRAIIHFGIKNVYWTE